MGSPGVSPPNLRVRSRGPVVLAVQRHLTQKELYTGPIDGRFGEQTESAVRAFQSSQNLTADGVVGPATWAALGDTGLDLSALATPPPDGDETPSTSGADDTLTTPDGAEASTTSSVTEVPARSGASEIQATARAAEASAASF
jgi:peptidoglycan hydrolase-like protein with peptidoglycan-binding domain